MLNKSGKSGHPCLVPDLRGNAFSFLLLSMMLTVGCCIWHICHICCCLLAKSRATLCDPMDYSTSGFLVLYYLPEFAPTHDHWASDAIQPSHPLSPPSPALSLSQHQSLSQCVGSLHQVARVLELQHQSFQWMFRGDFHSISMVWSPCCLRESQEFFSSTTVQEHQFFGTQPSLWSTSHNRTWLRDRP